MLSSRNAEDPGYFSATTEITVTATNRALGRYNAPCIQHGRKTFQTCLLRVTTLKTCVHIER
jgi:hypothetical protein